MIPVDRDQFNQLWHGARSQIFRLEQYREYAVPSDLAIFRRFVNGERISSAELHPDWYKRIAKKVEEGVRVDRVRIFDLPIPTYQQYEIDWGYMVGARYGQATWAMRRSLFDDLAAEAQADSLDFWIFDQRPILVAYTAGMDYIGPYQAASEEDEVRWLSFGEKLLSRAFSLGDFCSANRIPASDARVDWFDSPPNLRPIP